MSNNHQTITPINCGIRYDSLDYFKEDFRWGEKIV